LQRVSILSHYLYIASKEVNVSYTIMNNIDYKVGIYIRLSREDEEKEKYQESESIGNQRTLLMQYIKENKLNFISEYVDDGVSGTSFDRPAFNRMIADIETR
jgi:DNA invertase Pin-like site-specific DNA recombinase